MIFRLSQKLNAKIKGGNLKNYLPHENPYADWSAHLFTVARVQHILLTNTQSLYSIVRFGKGITDGGGFIGHALDSIREFMHDDGQQFAYHNFIATESAVVTFAKPLNRSVIGSMNELIVNATQWLAEGDLSPHDVGFKLNDVLISSLAGPNGGVYGKPKEAFRQMGIPRLQ
jgi:Domain of unknown function (DUF6933)